jgi:hypothetical protein
LEWAGSETVLLGTKIQLLEGIGATQQVWGLAGGRVLMFPENLKNVGNLLVVRSASAMIHILKNLKHPEPSEVESLGPEVLSHPREREAHVRRKCH